MGVVADAVLAGGGRATGVVPAVLNNREILHQNLTALHVVETMHQRKAKMAALADAFMVLPGGYGTLEEFFEAITWAQLGIHAKPVALYNIAGYFNPLLGMIEQAFEQVFIPETSRPLLIVGDTLDAVLDQIAAHDPTGFRPKWNGIRP